MSTYYSPVKGRESQFYRDHRGILTSSKRDDEVLNFNWDITDALESGETISSVDYSDASITVNSESESGNVITFSLTDTGYLVAQVTLSSGRVIEERFQWLSENEPPTDYRE